MTVTLEDLASFMNDTSLAEGNKAPLLKEHLDAAIEYVTSKVGPIGDAAIDFDVYAGPNQRQLVLPATHLKAVTSVTDPDGRTVTINLRRDADLLSGVVTVPHPRQGTWTIAAQARDTVTSCELAIKIIAQHLWGTQRGTGGGRAAMFANQGDDDGPTPVGFAIPHRAAQLLEPFVQVA